MINQEENEPQKCARVHKTIYIYNFVNADLEDGGQLADSVVGATKLFSSDITQFMSLF